MTHNQGPTLKQPPACSKQELTEFERLVGLGGEVTATALGHRIRGSELLAFIPAEPGKFIAVGALKRPARTYRTRVFTKARSSQRAADFRLELGWVYVEQEHRGRGLANTLVEALVNAAGRSPLYATSRLDNFAMHSALSKFGFTQSGSAYESEQDDDQLLLFVRPA